MHEKRSLSLLLFVALCAYSIFAVTMSFADTVRLKNGNSIDAEQVLRHGDKGPGVPKGKIRLEFSNGGWMLIDESDVLEVINNKKDEFEEGEDS